MLLITIKLSQHQEKIQNCSAVTFACTFVMNALPNAVGYFYMYTDTNPSHIRTSHTNLKKVGLHTFHLWDTITLMNKLRPQL